MSCNYADGLSPYHDKGQLGLEEKFDSKSVVNAKVLLLTKWMNEAKHVVVHTGAGISTSAGIPDFRGPKGVWTLEEKGEKPDFSTDFNDAIPTVTHMAITKLVEKGKVKYVVSQNIDGLHLRSNLPRKYLSELHGNMFTEQCNACGRQFVRSTAVSTVGQKSLNKPCPTLKPNGRHCRGRLHDTILDWEHNLPENDLGMADYHSCLADLSLCLGTTMQIVPSGNLPLYTKKHGGKLVICNLQPTKHNRKADLIIHAYVDEIMALLMKNLNLKIPKYSVKNDPTKIAMMSPDRFMEWTISDYALKKMKKVYEEKCGTKEAKKRLEMIDDDLPLSVAKNLKRTRVKDDEDSDLEVLDVIVKPRRSAARESSSKRNQKKASPAAYNSTITVKKVTSTPKKGKYETEKITIKKNVTPTKTKYEIVQPKPKKNPKCEIVYDTDNDACNDLDMICESDDDEMTNNFTYNFRRYLYDEKESKDEEDVKDVSDVKKVETEDVINKNTADDKGKEVKDAIKVEESKTDVYDAKLEEGKDLGENPKTDCISDVKMEEDDHLTEQKDNNIEDSACKTECKKEELVNTIEEDDKVNSNEETEKTSNNIHKPPDEVPKSEPDKTEIVLESEKIDPVAAAVAGDIKIEGVKSETANNAPGNDDIQITDTDCNKEEETIAQAEAEESKSGENEVADLIKSAEIEPETGKEVNARLGESAKEAEDEKESSNNKTDNIDSNVDTAIDKLVPEQDPAQFNNANECPVNQENFEFYNNSSGLDYMDNNYYNF